MKNGEHDNDNEPLSFSKLGLAAALVLNRIRNAHTLLEFTKQEHEDRDRQTGSGRTQEDRAKDHREAVDQRLRDLAAFERRVSGNKN